jgi:hypothetical protein
VTPFSARFFQGNVSEEYGRTERSGFKGTTDPKTGIVTTIDRQSGQINITIDFQKRDDAQSAYDNKLQPNAPPTEQHVVDHEFGHAVDMNDDMVREYNQSEEQAEKNAEDFANKIEKEKDSMSEPDANKRVREILGMPAKGEKKKKDDD